MAQHIRYKSPPAGIKNPPPPPPPFFSRSGAFWYQKASFKNPKKKEALLKVCAASVPISLSSTKAKQRKLSSESYAEEASVPKGQGGLTLPK
jgi:hypothetical protein